MTNQKILVIDDEEIILRSLGRILEEEGFRVSVAKTGTEGIEKLSETPDLVITDLKLPQMDGLSVLKKIHEIDKELPVILLTAHGSIQSATEAMKLGATDYVTKPFDSDELLVTIRKALETKALKQEVDWLRNEAMKQISYDELNGQTQKMRDLMKMVDKVANSTAHTVLLEGESGTGKNYVARMMHFKSKQKNSPFMEINCASLPENLIESELFGHERGSFTDAKQLKKGLFEVAKGGTVFLDEISEMSLSTQAKLLQAIECRMFRRVGGVQDIETDVRIIAATNINLKEAVAQKRFREDLYFRLQLIPIHIPPLRERPDDIPIL
ncbi:MAG: sigma-54-dependent Fis family transcriptional regulator, partial [Deltaproteobacteria bacterium]|nr:sigma-54-dependent Fis family transcriptional regulator [Deltaproteobacteria bacterium]